MAMFEKDQEEIRSSGRNTRKTKEAKVELNHAPEPMWMKLCGARTPRLDSPSRFREADRRSQETRRGSDLERDECVLREDVSRVLQRILRYDSANTARYTQDEFISYVTKSNIKDDEALRILNWKVVR